MLQYHDHRRDPASWSQSLGVSREAIELYLQSDVIDLHIDSFIWNRVFRYDLTRRHGHGLLGARFYSQVDLPRLREARVTGGVWAITTNPLVPGFLRGRLFLRNLQKLSGIFAAVPDEVAVVRTVEEYRAARAADRHAVWFAIQGGAAIEDLSIWDRIPDTLLRVTLVHFNATSIGSTSMPASLRPSSGLTAHGREFVRRLNERRIFVDLAHINRAGFFDAVAAHDKTQPLMVSHTGIAGVHPHWRNVDDEQLRAVASTGGVVGVMYQSSFLGDPANAGRAETIVDHLEHIVRTVGEDFAALGSDWDGAILTPRDMPTCLELPRLVELMLRRGFTAERIGKILGGNFLRALALLRG